MVHEKIMIVWIKSKVSYCTCIKVRIHRLACWWNRIWGGRQRKESKFFPGQLDEQKYHLLSCGRLGEECDGAEDRPWESCAAVLEQTQSMVKREHRIWKQIKPWEILVLSYAIYVTGKTVYYFLALIYYLCNRNNTTLQKINVKITDGKYSLKGNFKKTEMSHGMIFKRNTKNCSTTNHGKISILITGDISWN